MKSVILDTDIGCDIDDTWALCHLLNSPELSLKLVTTVSGNTVYRASVVAKVFKMLNVTHIPIGIGTPTDMPAEQETLRPWLEDFRLADYRGPVEPDGVAALAAALRHAEEPTLICIGPLNNAAAIATLYPELCHKTHLVAMAGSLRRGLGGKPGRFPEWNIRTQVKAAQTAFEAPWKTATITPLDTCAKVVLEGQDFAQVRESKALTAKLVMQGHRTWRKHVAHTPEGDGESASSTLFDTVAVFLAYSHDFLTFRNLFLHVDGRGFLQLEGPRAKPFSVALDWTDLQAYKKHLVRRIDSTCAEDNPRY